MRDHTEGFLPHHFADGRPPRCPGSTLEALSGQAATGLYESSVVGGGKGPDEHNVSRVIDGHENRFIVQYAVRGTKTMTPDLRAEWIKNLSTVTLMDAPQPSRAAAPELRGTGWSRGPATLRDPVRRDAGEFWDSAPCSGCRRDFRTARAGRV